MAEVWPTLEIVVHGGVKFDPYRATFATLLGSPVDRLQESYPCSEGFIACGDPATGLLRLLFDHGIFYEFVPVDELGSDRPTRHWLADVQTGVNYAIVVSTCAGMWSHVIGDTVRFESLKPPLLTFTGRTKYTLSAFGEHLISEEVEAAVASASTETGASVRDWHVGPVFHDPLGHHLFVIEFVQPPPDLADFRHRLDTSLARNAHYEWFRAEGGGLARAGASDHPTQRLRRLDAFPRPARRPAQGPADGQHRHPDRPSRHLPQNPATRCQPTPRRPTLLNLPAVPEAGFVRRTAPLLGSSRIPDGHGFVPPACQKRSGALRTGIIRGTMCWVRSATRSGPNLTPWQPAQPARPCVGFVRRRATTFGFVPFATFPT